MWRIVNASAVNIEKRTGFEEHLNIKRGRVNPTAPSDLEASMKKKMQLFRMFLYRSKNIDWRIGPFVFCLNE